MNVPSFCREESLVRASQSSAPVYRESELVLHSTPARASVQKATKPHPFGARAAVSPLCGGVAQSSYRMLCMLHGLDQSKVDMGTRLGNDDSSSPSFADSKLGPWVSRLLFLGIGRSCLSLRGR